MLAIEKPMGKRTTKENYVNNREFLDALMVFRKDVADAKESGGKRPRVPNYVGECF